MATDDFKVADGQYSLMINENNVSLRRNVQKQMNLIYKFLFLLYGINFVIK